MKTRGARLSVERGLALLGLLGLFLVAGICVSLVTQAAGEEDESDATPGASATATPTRESKPKPKPKPTPLTAQERAQRSAAAQLVRGQGFDPVSRKAYHPDQTLRVMLGESSTGSRSSGVAAGRRAFFFVGDSFIQSDAQEPSAKLRIVRQTENTVTLGYGLTSGGEARVRFEWDGSALGPQRPVPPAAQRAG